MWQIEYYSERVEAEIDALPDGMLARYLRYTNSWQKYGPNLGMPHSRAMGDGLFELRVKAKEGVARVFFCTVIERRIVVLHSFIKKTQKTPKRELNVARRRLKEVKTK